MKKTTLLLTIFTTLFFYSCNDTSDKKNANESQEQEEKGFINGKIDAEYAAEEYCACADKEGDDKTKCHDEWVAKYKNATGSEEEGKKLGEKMVECDAESALSILTKM